MDSLFYNHSIMANKRNLKKALNFMIEEVIHESFMNQTYDPTLTDVTNQIIVDAIGFNNIALSKISAAKNKSEMKPIITEIESTSVQLFEKLEALHS